MTKNERLSQLVHDGTTGGHVLFHPIFMHFAARFFGSTYREFASDYRVLVESNVRCLEFFDYDAIMLLSDPYRETSAFGAKVTFPEDGVPQCRDTVVTTIDDVRNLKNPDLYRAERTRGRIDACRYSRELLGDATPIIGWVEGPLAEACDLAGVNDTLLKIALEPDFVRALMDTCLITAKDFARAQVENGATIIGVGDAICSQIAPDMYREMIVPLHIELFDYIHSLGALVKLHICGNITHLLKELPHEFLDIVDIDWMVDMEEAYDALGRDTIVCGNLDPVSVIQDLPGDTVFERSKDLVQRMQGKKFILSGGCEITVNTPVENITKMKDAAMSG